MTKIPHRLIASAASIAMLAAAAFFAPLALAQAHKPHGSAAAPMAPAPAMAGGTMDMKSMMKEHNDKMGAMAMTGNADVDFAMMMKVHHQGAIDMAEMELKHGKEPQMKKMAKDIIAAQKKEIAQFDKFLASHAKPMDAMKK